MCTCISRMCGMCTSCYPQHPHDPDDSGVDGQSSTDLNLLQNDTHYWQEHDGQVQLVPPREKKNQMKTITPELWQDSRNKCFIQCQVKRLVPVDVDSWLVDFYCRSHSVSWLLSFPRKIWIYNRYYFTLRFTHTLTPWSRNNKSCNKATTAAITVRLEDMRWTAGKTLQSVQHLK